MTSLPLAGREYNRGQEIAEAMAKPCRMSGLPSKWRYARKCCAWLTRARTCQKL